MLVLAFFAWWAGRHRMAVPTPDPVPGAAGRVLFAAVGVAGMLLIGYRVNASVGLVLLVSGIGGWIWVAWRAGGFAGLVARLTRSPRPFIPMLLLLALPRLLIGGPLAFVGVVLALPSGIGQQVLYLLGLFAPLEALRGRRAVAAVVAALVFAALHVPLNLGAERRRLGRGGSRTRSSTRRASGSSRASRSRGTGRPCRSASRTRSRSGRVGRPRVRAVRQAARRSTSSRRDALGCPP